MKISLILFFIFSFTLQAKTLVHFLPKANVQDLASQTILNAEEQIFVSIYSFSSVKIRKALIDQLKNGVKVKLLVNNWKNERVIKFVKPIVDAGGEVRGTPKINHHKFIITDADEGSAVLFNSSANFSGSSRAAKYDENIVICDDCFQKIEAFSSEFRSIFKYSNKVIGKNDAVKPTASEKKYSVGRNFDESLFTTSNMKPSFRSGNISYLKNSKALVDGLGGVERRLAKAIDSAKTSLFIATGHFRSKPLYDAVLRAVKRGVKVEIVLDGQEYISKSKQSAENKKVKDCMKTKTEAKCYERGIHFGRLLSKVTSVKFKYYAIRWDHSYAQQMHSKYMIIDEEVVYTGSYNWSYNAEFNSLENVSIHKEDNVILAFINNFKNVSNYSEGKKGLDKLLSKYKAAKSKIDIVFNPMSLSVSEIDRLKSAALAKCPSLYTIGKGSYSCKF